MLFWRQMLSDWYLRHASYVNAKTIKKEPYQEWFTHKMTRKAYVHILGAMPHMFAFLDNPHIPKTTNALESFFGHLKENISPHRGLTKKHYQNYVKWYLYFRTEASKKR